jgi:hypothetical protein
MNPWDYVLWGGIGALSGATLGGLMILFIHWPRWRR